MSGSERVGPTDVDALAALRIPAFRRFFVAALMSNSGAWLQGIAMPYVMFQITESGAWVGASVFALMVPMALTGPVAGPLADRIPRRRILVMTQSVLALVAIGLALAWWLGVREPLAYVALSVLYGTVNGFNMPAWQAYVSDLVPREALMNAITLNSTQFNAARAIGPSVGGVVLATLGPGWSFAGNAFSFVFVVATLLTLPAGQIREGAGNDPVIQQFAQGFAYALEQPGIVTAYIAGGLVAFFGGTLTQVHLVLFAEEVFGVGEFRFGLLVSAFGVGAVLAAPWLTAVAPRYRKSSVLVAGLAAYGIGELVLATTDLYWIGVVGVLVAGGAHLTTASTTNTSIQLQVAEAMRGRVMAMYLMVFTLGMPIGAIVQGALTDVVGPRAVVFGMGSVLLTGTLLLRVSGRSTTLDAA